MIGFDLMISIWDDPVVFSVPPLDASIMIYENDDVMIYENDDVMIYEN